MNGLPYYKAYPRDFFEGTVGMDFEAKAAYRLLLDLIYMHGGRLVDDARFIAGHLGCSVRKWNAMREAILATGKVIVSDGYLGNYRADKELDTLKSFQTKQRENGSKPKKNKNIAKATAEPKPNHTEPEPDTEERGKPLSKRARRATRINPDAEVTEAQLRAGFKRGHSEREIRAQFDKFKTSALANGRSYVDWDAAFVTWLDSEYFRLVFPKSGNVIDMGAFGAGEVVR